MPKKAIHPVRKAFRRVLFVCLAASMGFFIAVVALRVTYKNDRPIEGALQARIFHLDVMKHQAYAVISDDEGDMDIAVALLKLGFFSRIYSDAGFEMLQAKADKGYQPVFDLLAEIKPNTIHPPVQDK